MKKLGALALLLSALPGLSAPRIISGTHPSPREQYAADKLRETAKNLPDSVTFVLAKKGDAALAGFAPLLAALPESVPEAFSLRRAGSTIIVAGSDASGVLYGALELMSRIQQEAVLPSSLQVDEHPHMKLRGTALGMQKPEITYDNAEYDYRYTPADFPFFYDKAQWTKYLDMLASERFNALYLWNGHPFTSLLRLPRYPEAQELSSAQLDQNIAMFRWLTAEADKRGIWLIQGFYNIHLSHTFARAHGLENHLSSPTPLAAEYTRYCISEFIREYPSAGLLITLGEAMGPHYGPQWMTGAVIPGVKDGLAQRSAQLGHAIPQPPIIVRRHATDIDEVMARSRPLYANIDTMFKWNGESLTWTDVRGPVLTQFQELVPISQVQIANIHLLSNLEPFRWGSPEYIQRTVQSFERIGISGLHLYPLRFWEWPVTADRVTPMLQQTDRDWVWFEAWGRYAWNPGRNPKSERAYWIGRFAAHYGTQEAAAHLLDAYQLSAHAAPRLLPRIGITEGNRQAFSLGMTMPELIDPKRFGAIESLWSGDGPDGERLDEYVAAEIAHKPHHGETPVGVAQEEEADCAEAVKEAEAAAPSVTSNRDEYQRVVNDMRAIHALTLFYQAKTLAAEQVLLYAHDHDSSRLDKAGTLLAESVDAFRALTLLTNATYRDAAALHTTHRRIPVTVAPDTLHWKDILPLYEKELAVFRSHAAALRNSATEAASTPTSLDRLFE